MQEIMKVSPTLLIASTTQLANYVHISHSTHSYIYKHVDNAIYIVLLTCAFRMFSSSICGCSNELATLLIVLACSIADTTISLGLLDVLT